MANRTWTIYICPKCKSPENIERFGEAVICKTCSLHMMRSEAPIVKVVPKKPHQRIVYNQEV